CRRYFRPPSRTLISPRLPMIEITTSTGWERMKASNQSAFVCHAGEDNAFAKRLGEGLFANGVVAFVDDWEILPGDRLIDKVFREGIPRATVFIIILSKNSIEKPWVREELDAALVLRIEGQMKIIPVRIDGCEVPLPLKATA